MNRLDISIPQLDSAFTVKGHLDANLIKDFLNTEITLIEKIDGLKITLWRNDQDFDPDYRKNWIIAYKNKILYDFEFGGIDDDVAIKATSFNQFALIFNHLNRIHHRTQDIPKNTEIFLEFSASKHTLMQKYETKQLFCLGYSRAKGIVCGGYLNTYPETFDTNVTALANTLMIDVPPVLFMGFPGDSVDPTLLPIEQYKDFKRKILTIPSCIGPTIEGVICKWKNKFYKFQQENQVDRYAREKQRQQYKGTPEEEYIYWNEIQNIAERVIHQGTTLKEKLINLKHSKVDLPKHTKKSEDHVWDDFYVTGRIKILESLPENQNALVIGRFQPLTKAHADIIRTAAKTHFKVFVGVVSGFKSSKNKTLNPLNFNLRKRLIDELNIPNVEVVELTSGFIRTIISKLPAGISHIYCGSDRKDSYAESIKGTNIKIVEIPRNDDISGTNLRSALRNNNIDEFYRLSDPLTYKFFEELRKEIIVD